MTARAMVIVVAAMFVAPACDSQNLLAPSDVRGSYALREYSAPQGNTPSQGLLHLMPNGEVERRLSFHGESEAQDFVTHGRYRIRNGALEIAFFADGTSGELFYRPAAYSPDYILLTYTAPSDGDVIEVYQKITFSAH